MQRAGSAAVAASAAVVFTVVVDSVVAAGGVTGNLPSAVSAQRGMMWKAASPPAILTDAATHAWRWVSESFIWALRQDHDFYRFLYRIPTSAGAVIWGPRKW